MMVGEHSGATVSLIIFNFLIFGATVALLHLSVFPQFSGGKNVFFSFHIYIYIKLSVCMCV